MSQLTPEQLEQVSQISSPILRQRFALFYQLPQDLQASMFSEQTSGSVWQITKEKHGLSDNHISAVAKIIGLIFLGELPIKNFIMALQNDLRIDVQTATAIAQDINQIIFQPVRESLMLVHGIKHDANQRMNTNGTNQSSNTNNGNGIARTAPTQPAVKQNNPPMAPRTQSMPTPSNDFEAQRRREEVLNKIRSGQNGNGNTNGQPPRPIPPRPPVVLQNPNGQNQAKPASWRNHIPRKNVIDLRNGKIKNKDRRDYFFTA